MVARVEAAPSLSASCSSKTTTSSDRRSSLLLELQDGIEVVGAVSDGNARPSAPASVDPHVCVMDFRLPGMDGVETTIALT